jgi:stage III sporulation protein AC
MIGETSLLFQIAGIGIIVAMIHTVLKQMGKEEYAQWITLIGFIIVLFIVISNLAELFTQIRSVFLFQSIIGGF